MTENTGTTQITAVAVMHGQAYTDFQLAQVRADIQRFRYETLRAEQRAMRLKIVVHITLLVVGILVAYLVTPYLLPVISGVPSIMIEGADRFLRIT